jgi:hypothetical protein
MARPSRFSREVRERAVRTLIEAQYPSIRYTERLAEAGIGLFKAGEIYRRGPWKGLEDVQVRDLIARLRTCPLPSSSRPIVTVWRPRPPWRFSRNELSGNPGRFTRSTRGRPSRPSTGRRWCALAPRLPR